MFGFSRMLSREDGRAGLWRRLLLVLTLAAFAQASYLTQTHIHMPAAAGTESLGQNAHGKSPLGDDPAHCPLCQEYLFAGAYITPAPIVLPLPVLTALSILRLLREMPFIGAVSHDWRGRAPPLP